MKPRRIFVVRHGESEGNVDKTIYTRKPDYALNLTANGVGQAESVGEELKNIIGSGGVQFYISPFYRARQTAECIIDRIGKSQVCYREDPRLREQEWNTRLRVEHDTEELERERDRIGSFYFRFELGESCADVYDRLSSFFDSLFRDFEKPTYPDNAVIVAHGMTNRVFLMRWFHWTVEQFELLRNPKNCEYFLLERQVNGKFELSAEPTRYEQSLRQF